MPAKLVRVMTDAVEDEKRGAVFPATLAFARDVIDVDGKVPAKATCDTSVITRNVELGQSLRISGTPTIFLADGSRIGGYVPAAELEKAMDSVKR